MPNIESILVLMFDKTYHQWIQFNTYHLHLSGPQGVKRLFATFLESSFFFPALFSWTFQVQPVEKKLKLNH